MLIDAKVNISKRSSSPRRRGSNNVIHLVTSRRHIRLMSALRMYSHSLQSLFSWPAGIGNRRHSTIIVDVFQQAIQFFLIRLKLPVAHLIHIFTNPLGTDILFYMGPLVCEAVLEH